MAKVKTAGRRRRAVRGTGTVRRKNDGRFELRVSVNGARRSFMGRTLAEAQAKADAAKANDEPRRGDSPTVEEWLAEWLEIGKDRLDPQTWRPYEQHARLHIVPAIGNTRLVALTDTHIDRLHRFSRKKVGASTAHHVHMTLSSALSDAVKRGLIRINVAKTVPAPRRADQDIRPYSPQQVARFIESVLGDPLEALFVLAVTLGPREGELLGLRWRHVDLEGSKIRIVGNATASYDSGGPIVADPKTRASSRTLHPLPRVVVDAFKRATNQHGSDLVWPAPIKGGPMTAATFQRMWHRARERAGLPYAKFHNLRHTAATIMLDDGVPVHVVSAILGHASVAITLQLYAHVTRTGLSGATAALDARYGSNKRRSSQ
jgi:integrase